MNLAVIPARGGSKRLPRKNIRPFGGQPMIAWSIQAARDSGCFDRIVVSTDDPEIADVARSLGAEVPFMRPPELADDFTGTVPVIRHAARWALLEMPSIEFVCCLYATAPFVHAEDLRLGLHLLRDGRHSYAFSVTSYPFPIQRSIRITDAGNVAMLHPEHLNTRSQDLETAYHDAGQFYWGTSEAWLSGRPIFSEASVPVVIPRYRVQDIDTDEDWERAEWLLKAMQAGA